MNYSLRPQHRPLFIAACLLLCLPALGQGADRRQPPVNIGGAPVLDAKGQHINYDQKRFAAMSRGMNRAKPERTAGAASITAPRGFVPASPNAVSAPFWQYAIFGSGIGASNILIGPAPAGGGVPEILIGGNSGSGFGTDDFWQAIRRNPSTGNYDQLFVSPLYSSSIERIGVANVVGDSNQEIVIMLADGRIYLNDLATKAELGYVNTGVNGLEGLGLVDLDGDGRAELVVTTANDLFIFNGAGNLLWQVPGAGGYEVVVGQMDNDPAIEIATTIGKVVDAGTHAVQWTRNGGFGVHLKLAPFPGETYQQLIVAEGWQFVYSYDVARQLPRWSINTPQDIGAIQISDVDNDGMPEVLIGDNQWGSVHVHDLINQGQKWATNNPEHGVTSVAVGDVDGDGVVDLLWGAGWTSSGSDYLYVANTTGSHNIKWQSIDLQGPFLGPAIGDLDGDGQLELVVCSYESESGYDSGRILVFDLATLALRAVSAPVLSNQPITGLHDFKLRDLEGDGRMDIVIGTDSSYDGAIAIYGFNSSNTFTLKWSNTTRPSGSPFNFVEVADLDNNGTLEIIAGNTVAHTGSPGVYVYIYDYPSGANPWRSVNLSAGFSAVNGMLVQDLDGNGSKEIAALVANGDLYTFDGPSRQLRSLSQSTGYTLLSDRKTASGLVAGDSAGTGHFLQYANNTYTESFTRPLATGTWNGISVLPNGALWTGSGSTLSLRLPSAYNIVEWQSPSIGTSFGRFVATDVRNGQTCVFSSARHAVAGLTYTLQPMALASAVSRKTHGPGHGQDFDIPLPLSGLPGVECRSGGTDGNHTLVLTMNGTVTSGHARMSSRTGAVLGEPTFSGNQMTINLTGIPNGQRITVLLDNIGGPDRPTLASSSITFGALEGDVTNNRVVNSSDVSQIMAFSGQVLDATNFWCDLNMTGTINSSDVSAAQARSGTALP